MIQGILIEGYGSFYTVKTPEKCIEARARGRMKNDNIRLLIGDNVLIEEENGTYAITEVLPRKNSLIRPAVANVDRIIVVIAKSSPNPNFKQIDKLLCFLEHNGLEVAICINKSDLKGDIALKKIYEKAGYTIIETNTVCENPELDELKKILKNKISAFAGCSGVGKSSLINLLAENTSRKTGEVGKIKRGKHTTTHASLIELETGGFIADTPGFSVVDLSEISKEELGECFIEFNNYTDCKFIGCSHTNEPGCDVISHLESGDISEQRYNSYLEIYKEIAARHTVYKKK